MKAPHVAGVVVVHPQQLVVSRHAAGLGRGVHPAHEERAAELVEILVRRQSSQQATVATYIKPGGDIADGQDRVLRTGKK